MRHIIVKPAKPEDAKEFTDFSLNTPNNLFDPDTITYPTTFVFKAFDNTGSIAYVPIQQPFFMESLAINPNADKLKVSSALKELTQATITQAYIKGVGEIYFVCNDPSTQEFAKSQAFVEMPWKVYRLKLKDLENEKES